MMKKQNDLDAKRERKWVAMVDSANGLEVFVRKKKQKLKERVRKGVPRQWRRSVWPALLDVEVKPPKGGTVFGGAEEDDDVGEDHKEEPSQKKKKKKKPVSSSKGGTFRKYGPKSYQAEAAKSMTSYSSLSAQTSGDAPKDSIFEVIERDLTRTFPKNKFFETKVIDGGRADRSQETPGISSLRRMLRSYAVFDKEVEYCQGMNYVAALLIIHVCDHDDDDVNANDPTKGLKSTKNLLGKGDTPPPGGGLLRGFTKKKKKGGTRIVETPEASLDGSAEEEAFWLFVAALKSPRTSLRELYRPGMIGSRRALFVYDKLLNDVNPAIHSHLENQGVIPDMYATHWLVTIFTAQFPFALVARVWDQFFAEGWKPVFKVAIAVLLTYDSQIKSKPFEQLLTFLKEIPDILDVDKVLHIADTKVHLTTDQLHKYEQQFLKTLQA